jgi:HEPN domain-containing protein
MRKETEEWIIISQEDLQAAEYLFEKALHRIACYHVLNSIYRSRYPLDTGLLPWGEPTEKDAAKALDIAKNMSAWFKGTFKR